MRLRRALLVVFCLLALAVASVAADASDLSDVEQELMMLEADAASTPAASSSSAVDAAKAYAASTVQGAVKEGAKLVESAAKEGEKEAAAEAPAAAAGANGPDAPPAAGAAGPAGPAGAAGPNGPDAAAAGPNGPNGANGPDAPPQAGMGPPQTGSTVEKKAEEEKPKKRLSRADEQEQREREREERQKARAKAEAEERLRQAALTLPPFRSQGLARDTRGVYGGVHFGLAKADSLPSTPASAAPDARTHMNKYDPHGRRKDVYGRPKPCLKDIAAHFDEGAIYESKKMALQAQMEGARSRKLVERLRRKLLNLETWHAMMQKKFLMSAEQEKEHEKRMERLFDAHLPAELKKQLDANKVAKRAAQPEPFPEAMARAKKILRMKRNTIAKDARLARMGRKKMIRPEINDPDFPSMDPISTHLREQLWRRVGTEDAWSTDAGEMELGNNLVNDAHKLHGDFVDGPIAAPLLKGKLYNPDTEILGRPHFLQHFPWPKDDLADKVTMNDKVKVEQTYHQTW